jgi:hypothetical protein
MKKSRGQTAARVFQGQADQAARLKLSYDSFESSAPHLQQDGALETGVAMD